VKVWSEFDPDCTHYIKTLELPKLLSQLPIPLGLSDLRHGFKDEFDGWKDIKYYKQRHVLTHDKYFFMQLKYVRILNIHSHNEKVYFPEVLWACMS
jgi:hypothetical protein